MAESWAVKYRPRTFEEICSQRSVIKVLTKQIETNQLKNCYLFSGPSGTGKTTTARAFATLINEGRGEPIEIDGASNNGVDNVRTIIKGAQERAIDCKYKIYIIDECHAITNQAWQAFLKCIEEPPTYTIFMFCTTDPQKIPATVLNRVMKFNLTKIETSVIQSRLEYICKCEGVDYTQEALEYIAKISDGGMRDSISSMQKCADYGPLDITNVLECLGSFSYKTFFELVNALIDGVEGTVLSIVEEYHSKGYDLKLFIEQLLNFCLDVAKYAIFKNCNLVKIPSSMEPDLINATNIENASGYYMYLVDKLLDLKQMLKNDTAVKDTIEVSLLRIARYM